MNSILSSIIFAISITMPNVLLMLLGFIMQRKGQANKEFIETASKMVFNFCLPCLLFFSVLKSNISYSEHINLIGSGLIATFVLFFIAETYVKVFVKDIKDRGVFSLGVFRPNMTIIGLATVANAYGDNGVSLGALYISVMSIVYNVLSVITLSRTQSNGNFKDKFIDVFKKIITNPLIIAMVLALIYKGLHLPKLPEFITKTGGLLGGMALPLALICAGAALDIKMMLKPSGLSMQASLGRIVLAPIVAVVVGVWLQLEPMQMGILYLMFAGPTAAVNYVMAKAMGGNETLAANILAFTVVFGMVGIGVGAAILRGFGMI